MQLKLYAEGETPIEALKATGIEVGKTYTITVNALSAKPVFSLKGPPYWAIEADVKEVNPQETDVAKAAKKGFGFSLGDK